MRRDLQKGLLRLRLAHSQFQHSSTQSQSHQCNENELQDANLGDISVLPLELLNMIISSFNIAILYAFKAVNRKAHYIANSHPQFQFINSLAQIVLHGLRKVKVEPSITLQDLFDSLCSINCCGCGNFGGYMYLLTSERICGRCLLRNPWFKPMREWKALEEFRLTPEELQSVPRIQTYPGVTV
jgi:hypothetical protein